MLAFNNETSKMMTIKNSNKYIFSKMLMDFETMSILSYYGICYTVESHLIDKYISQIYFYSH